MKGLSPILLVADREIRERVASRSFQVSSVMTIIFVLAALFLPALLSNDSAPSYTIGTTGDAPDDLVELVVSLAPDPETEVTLDPYTDQASLEEAVRDGEVDLGVVSDTTIIQGPDTGTQALTLVMGALQTRSMEQRALDMGLTQEQLSQMFGTIDIIELDTSDSDERIGLAFIGTILLFVSIVTYGQWILIGVVEEKTSRVVEVILGALSPRHLLAGKVVGIGALGLAQLLVIAAVALFAAQGYADLDIPPIGFGIAAIVIGWFILGFTFYAAAYAVTGSLVSRQEDAQNASFPLTMVMLIAYFVAASVLGGDDNIVAMVLSIVPPFSPLAMPIRQASGIAAPWEVILAVVLMAVTTIGMLRVGGGIYAAGLLRSGGRTKWRDAFRSARS